VTYKTCVTCHTNKNTEDFGGDKSRIDGLNPRCLVCARVASREYYQQNREDILAKAKTRNATDVAKHQMRRASYRHRFGAHVTPELYEELAERQNDSCAICQRKASEAHPSGKLLHIDHDHTTGEIRGLLCSTCNIRLHALENFAWRGDAEKYLENPPGRRE